MDIDISKWLKNDLGLMQMSEADLSYFMFNPRHGALCRRFINFLAMSTLCCKKYPHVYVQEENLEAKRESVRLKTELRDSISNLDLYIKTEENKERELSFLKLKLNYLRTMEDLKKTSTEALENIADRPNFLIEQVSQNIDEFNYSNSNVGNIYDKLCANLDSQLTTMGPISRSQMKHVDDKLDDLICKTNTMHLAISKLYESINSEKSNVQCNLKKTSLQSLIGLKPPKFEEIELHIGLGENNSDLVDKVNQLNQQVLKLNNLYESRVSEIYKKHTEKLRDCSKTMDCLRKAEVSIKA